MYSFQKVRRKPNCSLRMGAAERMTPNVVDVAPDGTALPGVPRADHIEGIGALGAEPQLEALGQREVTRDRQINIAIARSVKEITRRVAVGGDAGHHLVLNKSRRIEPQCGRRMVQVGIANQLCAIIGHAVEVGIHAAVGDGEGGRRSAA